MKSILLATGVIVALAVTVTITLRTARGPRRAAAMMRVFLCFLPVLVVVWATTPDDLGFLPPGLLAEPRWFDLAACLFFYTCATCGTVLRPRAGDCCVFCSYSDQVCPPKRTGQPSC